MAVPAWAIDELSMGSQRAAVGGFALMLGEWLARPKLVRLSSRCHIVGLHGADQGLSVSSTQAARQQWVGIPDAIINSAAEWDSGHGCVAPAGASMGPGLLPALHSRLQWCACACLQGQTAGVIVEPLQGEGGINSSTTEFPAGTEAAV